MIRLRRRSNALLFSWHHSPDLLCRYEYTLWRQVAQILFALKNLNRRKPQERRPFMLGHSGHMPDEDARRFDDD